MGSQGGPSCNEALWQPHKGSPRIANGQHGQAGTKHLFCRVLSVPRTPCCSSSPTRGTRSSSGPSRAPGKGQPLSLPRHRLGGRHPSGFLAPEREVAHCPPAMRTGSPVCPRHGWKGPPDTAHTTHPLPMAYKRLVQFREIPVLPRPEGKKPQENKGEHFAKAMFAQVRFSFFLEVV